MSVTVSNGQIRPIQPSKNIVIMCIYSHIISTSYITTHSNTKICQVVLWIFFEHNMYLTGQYWIYSTVCGNLKSEGTEKAMICCAEPNQKGEHPCKIYPVTLCFACRRYSRSFPSVAARGGRAARAVGIRNPSNSARAQRRGERRILPRFWKSSPPNRRKNEICFFPGSSSVTPVWVPEADIPSRPCPVGPLRGP